MIKVRASIILIILLISAVCVGCTNTEHIATPTIQEIPIPEVTKEDQSQTPIVTRAEFALGIRFDMCTLANRQIWMGSIASPEDGNMLAEDGIGYAHPIWSPNGELLSLIVSKPIPQDGSNENSDSEMIVENLSIWIMAADSSSRQITTEIVSEIWYPRSSCVFGSTIGEYDWSPDSQHIIYANKIWDETGYQHQFFVVDIYGGNTQELFSSEIAWGGTSIYNDPYWLIDDVILFHRPSELLALRNVTVNSSLEFTTIPYPIEVLNQDWLPSLHSFSSNSSNLIMAIFPVLDTTSEGFNTYSEFWALDLGTDTWEYLGKINESGRISAGEHILTSCESNTLKIFDINTLELNNTFHVSSDLYLDCNSISITNGVDFDTVYYLVSDLESSEFSGFYLQIDAKQNEPVLFFDSRLLPLVDPITRLDLAIP